MAERGQRMRAERAKWAKWAKRLALACIGASIATFGLGGCATYSWHQEGRSKADAEADLKTCRDDATKAHPAVMQQTMITPGKVLPGQTVCSGTTCTLTPGGISPPVFGMIDINETSRASETRACMEVLGWKFSEDRN